MSSARVCTAERVWEDRFSTPQPDDLLSAIHEDHAGFVSQFRERMLAEPLGLRETLSWHGVPWRWAFAYAPDRTAEPVAYLIPNPEGPTVAVPTPAASVQERGRLPRPIVERLTYAPIVSGMLWPEWTLNAASLTQHLGDFVAMGLDPS